MKKQNEHIEKKVEHLLDPHNAPNPVQVPSDFTQKALEKAEKSDNSQNVLSESMKWAAVGLLILLNTYGIMSHFTQNQETGEEAFESDIELMIQEYELANIDDQDY